MDSSLARRAIDLLRKEGIIIFLRAAKDFVIRRSKYPFFYLSRSFRFTDDYYNFSEEFYKKICSFDTDRYTAPLNPYKIVYTSPASISKVTRRPLPAFHPKPHLFGRVKGGDWDRRDGLTVRSEYEHENPNYREAAKVRHGSTVFEDTILYKSFENHFINNCPWKDTQLYQWYESGIYKPDKYKPNLKKRFKRYDRLYDEIKQKGYKTQSELESWPFPWNLCEEIVVDIGRDGEFLFVNGRHRLAICKLLNLETIPVTISVRHKDWMSYRDEVWEQGLRTNHPDLEEFGQ